ncbi:MAG: sigma-54-dependent Fis family transcriptional regulator [Kofleriaceae bacterium]|jgi:DNA-binding NtrC family response regulator|nr:sigma-54-dependent Fis family transcriptional regulator [Kofleriaceae bacterium]MBP6839955.1 sigma-54-dependent Fis family transcriptional regulator [Kofleriaceae bacterium]
MAEPSTIARVLVVDDEPAVAEVVRGLLGPGYGVVGASDTASALAAALAATRAGASFDVVLLDYYLARERAEEVLQALGREADGARVILMSGREPSEIAIEALRLDAFDFVAKPLTRAELRLRVDRAGRSGRVPDGRPAATSGAGSSGREAQRRPRKSDVLIGGGAWIKALYERISMVAPTDVTVAIFGESGTGKELVARTIHNLSPRAECPFVVVNCAAIPESLLEDELFGHVRGAFTDASRDRQGLVAAAHTGTLFLDEIGEMSPPLQSKLLRVLQSQEFRRIGDDHDQRVDVRVITATNRDLEGAVAAGTFRQDLYYRIHVFSLELPPLRERREDLALLAHHFVLRLRTRVGKAIEGLSPAAVARLASYDFPGNVRELENKIHQALVIAPGPLIEPDDLALPPPQPRASRAATAPALAPLDLDRSFRDLKNEAVDRFEHDYLVALLEHHRGNLAAAARQAGMDRKNLWGLLKKQGIDPDRFR